MGFGLEGHAVEIALQDAPDGAIAAIADRRRAGAGPFEALGRIARGQPQQGVDLPQAGEGGGVEQCGDQAGRGGADLQRPPQARGRGPLEEGAPRLRIVVEPGDPAPRLAGMAESSTARTVMVLRLFIWSASLVSVRYLLNVENSGY